MDTPVDEQPEEEIRFVINPSILITSYTVFQLKQGNNEPMTITGVNNDGA